MAGRQLDPVISALVHEVRLTDNRRAMVIEISPEAAAAAAAPGLSDSMREHTRDLHTQAERGGIVRDLLLRRADRLGHGLHLRNLLPAYEALESSLERHAAAAALREIRRPALYRGPAIRSDLARLFGPAWEDRLPLLPEAARYAQRIDEAAETDPPLLMAHAYVRYLGDLNGGRVLRGLLAKSLDLDESMLRFYDFPQLGDPGVAAAAFRSALDRAGAMLPDQTPVISEAATAFRLNIAVSEAVGSAAARLSAAAGA